MPRARLDGQPPALPVTRNRVPEIPEPAPDEDPLAGLADNALITVTDAAKRLRCNRQTVQRAVRDGELPGFIPRGRDTGRTGRGMGYRIVVRDLRDWFFPPRIEVDREKDFR